MNSDDSDKDEVSGYDLLKHRLNSNLGFVDLGRITYGKTGAFFVRFCIVITQFGFCIGYGIFVGNVLYRIIFPEETNISVEPVVKDIPRVFEAFQSTKYYNTSKLNQTERRK